MEVVARVLTFQACTRYIQAKLVNSRWSWWNRANSGVYMYSRAWIGRFSYIFGIWTNINVWKKNLFQLRVWVQEWVCLLSNSCKNTCYETCLRFDVFPGYHLVRKKGQIVKNCEFWQLGWALKTCLVVQNWEIGCTYSQVHLQVRFVDSNASNRAFCRLMIISSNETICFWLLEYIFKYAISISLFILSMCDK